jgi:hypothetical protein
MAWPRSCSNPRGGSWRAAAPPRAFCAASAVYGWWRAGRTAGLCPAAGCEAGGWAAAGMQGSCSAGAGRPMAGGKGARAGAASAQHSFWVCGGPACWGVGIISRLYQAPFGAGGMRGFPLASGAARGGGQRAGRCQVWRCGWARLAPSFDSRVQQGWRRAGHGTPAPWVRMAVGSGSTVSGQQTQQRRGRCESARDHCVRVTMVQDVPSPAPSRRPCQCQASRSALGCRPYSQLLLGGQTPGEGC